jgi:thioredoxin-related protein
MTTRRQLVLGGTTLMVGGMLPRGGVAEAPILTEDGLYRQKWFLESFLELADDLDGAAKAGKRFAIIWELRGCPYCKETHLVNFAEPRIADYVKANFEILQLNIVGSRKVTDFDGKDLGEKQIAAKYGVRFTPTLQFFPETLEGLKERPPEKREVARAAGYYRPDDFLAMFRYVREKAYETQSFRDFLKRGS